MEIPCVKDCPDRTPTCHGKCEKYKAYAAWRAEERKKWAEERKKRAEEARIRNIMNAGKARMFRKKQIREKQGRK